MGWSRGPRCRRLGTLLLDEVVVLLDVFWWAVSETLTGERLMSVVDSGMHASDLGIVVEALYVVDCTVAVDSIWHH